MSEEDNVRPLPGVDVEAAAEAAPKLERVKGLPNITRMNIDPRRVLEKALDYPFAGVVVIGWDEDGERYFASSVADAADVNWAIDRAKQDLLSIVEELEEGGTVGPRNAG